MQAFSAQPQQRGFILAVVLWLLAAIAVAVGLLLFWSRERVQEATQLRESVDARIAMISLRDTLFYVSATVPTTQAGLPLSPLPANELAARRLADFGGFDRSPRGGELRMDGAHYIAASGAHVALQDEAGLIPLSYPVNSPIPVLLRAAGVPRAEHSALWDALIDYTDADSLRRLNGAEAPAYEKAGLAPPPGRPLIAVRELWRVYGWAALDTQAKERIDAWSTTGYGGPLNLNTVPEPLLRSILPACSAICSQRIARRAELPFLSGRTFEIETATLLPGDRDTDYRTVPSDALRLTLWGATGSAWRIHVRLTPLADRAAPWTVDAAYRVPRPPNDDAPQPIQSPLFAPPDVAVR